MIEFWLLMGAFALSLFGAFFHGMGGGRMRMNNINSSNLEPRGKSLSLVSWHNFTIFLLVGVITYIRVTHRNGRSAHRC